MKKLRSSIVGIDQRRRGLVLGFRRWRRNVDRSGPARAASTYQFSENYQSDPTVHVSISMWDMDATNVLRADVQPRTITEKGLIWCFAHGATPRSRVRASAWTASGSWKMTIGMLIRKFADLTDSLPGEIIF